ncbi:MAG: hypothetical protein C0403_03145 [Desulfobacterium sp.]|nr:hypothetical protein [Desulfobacterium sp.]
MEVSNLLRTWWNENAKRTERLLNWFSFVRRNKPDDDLLQLCVDIINSHPNNLFQNQGHNPIMMLLHTWGEKSPERCGPLLHSLFNAWFALNPGRNPFERDEIKAIDLDSFAEIEKKGPQAFLQGTTDALIRSIDMVVKDGNEGRNQYSFNLRTHSGHRLGFDNFLGKYRSALKEIAQDDPEAVTLYLKKLDPHKRPCLMHLHLEAIQANPVVLGGRLPALVTDKMVFDAGWREADWMSFAHACREAMPHLGTGEKKVLEQAILKYTPEIDFAIQILKTIKQKGEEEPYRTRKSIIYRLNHSGYKQWCILETIGERLISPYTRSRLHVLRRKFPKAIIKPPNNMDVSSVTSPIKPERCARMKDSHWLSAINSYDNNENSRNGLDFLNEAAGQLAFELQEATKKDPARFSDLSLKIPDTAHDAYVKNIIRGLAETKPPADKSSLRNAVKHAHNHPEKPFGLDIARLLEKHPHLAADTEILEILIWYASNGKANESNAIDIIPAERKTITIDTLIQHNESIHTQGMNCSRGSAWEALGSVLWKVPEVENRIWEAVETALKKEYLISVRCCIMKPLMPLFNMNKERFSDSIRKLIVLPDSALHQYDALRLSPLVTYTGIHMFPYIFRLLPELAEELCTKLLECGDKTKELIGAWLVFCESFRNNLYISKADKLASVSLNHRRLLAGVAGDAINWTENRHRAEARLIEFFFDEDEQVRNNAAEAFRSVQAKDVELYKKLAAKFLQSPAFANNGYSLLHMLENATCDVLDLVIEATKQVIIDISINGDRHGRRSTDVHQLQKLLKREYTSSESDPEARKNILDLIDQMLSHEIYGVDSIVTAHDRW